MKTNLYNEDNEKVCLVGNMFICKKKTNFKILYFVLQAIVMFLLFLLLVDKQTIYIIKGMIEELNIDSNIQLLLGRLFVGFRMMFYMPSFAGLFILLLQVVCTRCIIKNFLNISLRKFYIAKGKVVCEEKYVNKNFYAKSNVYLLNQRLLN